MLTAKICMPVISQAAGYLGKPYSSTAVTESQSAASVPMTNAILELIRVLNSIKPRAIGTAARSAPPIFNRLNQDLATVALKAG